MWNRIWLTLLLSIAPLGQFVSISDTLSPEAAGVDAVGRTARVLLAPGSLVNTLALDNQPSVAVHSSDIHYEEESTEKRVEVLDANQAEQRNDLTLQKVRRESDAMPSDEVAEAIGLPHPDSVAIIGWSVEGRPIRAYRFGDGPVFVAIVGGIHGGIEANTSQLVHQLVSAVASNPTRVPAAVSLFLIPELNPDGVLLPGAVGRVNANHVDLNRNWGCGWQPIEGKFWGEPFTAGKEPFSEPETKALRDLLIDNGFAVAVFYHSRGGFIFHGICGDPGAAVALGERVAAATGYEMRYGAQASILTSGQVTGGSTDYLTERGVAAIGIELTWHDELDWDQNQAALSAILAFAAESDLPAPASPPDGLPGEGNMPAQQAGAPSVPILQLEDLPFEP